MGKFTMVETRWKIFKLLANGIVRIKFHIIYDLKTPGPNPGSLPSLTIA